MSFKRVAAILFLLAFFQVASWASVQDDLDHATRSGKVAFILVHDKDLSGLERARSIIGEAMRDIHDSVMLELDRSDPGNASFVSRYRLLGAPMPLILVTGRNGSLAGGLPLASANSELLAKLVPSPKKAEILKAMQDGKAVYVVASRSGGNFSADAAVEACSQAGDRASIETATVRIDLDDPEEAPFLKLLKIDTAQPGPFVLVFNTKGQLTGNFKSLPDPATLTQAAVKKLSSCCAPGVDGSKSCK